jgi:hypothetical protein
MQTTLACWRRINSKTGVSMDNHMPWIESSLENNRASTSLMFAEASHEARAYLIRAP